MGQALWVSTRKGLFCLKQVSGQWKVTESSFIGDPVTLCLPTATCVFAALEHGHFGPKLHRSEDGVSWKEVAAPEYPTKPDDSTDETPWSLKTIWALEEAGADRPGQLWCGTIPGGLFRSADGGESWQMVDSLWEHPQRRNWFGGGADQPGIHSIVVDPRDSKRVLVAVSCGGVWETVDDGASWTVRAEGMRADFMPPDQAGDPTIQDPHCMVACPTDPDRLWVQHHCGIYKSVDGARSWQEIPTAGPSTFGFGVVVHPSDPKTAWFVPAISDQKRIPVDGKVVVTRTRDGGETFETLTQGLPQEHAYDLTYRHALAIDASGDHLAFGSTTGSLWVSGNQGDSWQQVAGHLPPIYAVRFTQS